MKVNIRPISNSYSVRLGAEVTQGKPIVSLSVETWKKWLHSEHSMIRNYWLEVELTDIPYYVSVHLVRHKFGVEHFVRSQRPDSYNPVGYDRRAARQDSLVNHLMVLNPQALINISQVRLCKKADIATREVWTKVSYAILDHHDPYVSAIYGVMMPRCEYRGGICYELKPCGLYPHYLEL